MDGMPSILYQTEHLVVVDKPAGMLVHRTARDKDETTFLVQTVRDLTGRHVYPVHRLDKPTSGALILAFDPETTAELSRLLAERRLHRTYVALVRGWMRDPVRIDYPLTRVSVRDGGPANAPRREAITVAEPVELYNIKVPAGRYDSARYTFVQLHPETGRTHQLRRHLKHVNHPIIGDRKYGDRDHNALFNPGLMLHAQSVTLPDGTTVEAPLPERFVRALEWLSSGRVFPILLACVFCLLTTGCFGPEETPDLQLEHVDSIVVNERDSTYIGDFLAMTPGPDSLLWTADYIRKRIVAMNDSGRVVETVGGEGTGPGEFINLFHVVPYSGGFLTKERGRYTRFNEDRVFIDTHILPEGVIDESFWGMTTHENRLLVGGTKFENGTGAITASADDTTVLVLDSTFQFVYSFGTFPEAYQQNEWTMRDRDIAVNSAGLASVVYRLSSELQIYLLHAKTAQRLDVVDFSSRHFKKPDASSTLGFSRAEQIAFLERTSLVNRVFFVTDDLVVVYYVNHGPNWNGVAGNDAVSRHFLAMHSIKSRNTSTSEIPGPLLGVDASGHLLIRLSNDADAREIGRFRVSEVAR